jgi:hypothetical protein
VQVASVAAHQTVAVVVAERVVSAPGLGCRLRLVQITPLPLAAAVLVDQTATIPYLAP